MPFEIFNSKDQHVTFFKSASCRIKDSIASIGNIIPCQYGISGIAFERVQIWKHLLALSLFNQDNPGFNFGGVHHRLI
jgi:hypothetical protein